jgi:anion-transporting  ArsA/GET3 family ATPase
MSPHPKLPPAPGTDAPAPRVVVCAGGGGVGKTTTAAALSLALARRGNSTLIVTIDPARRLAGALGVPIADTVTQVTLPAAGGRLFALMPDPRRSLRTFVEYLFEDDPGGLGRVLASGIYQGFADAAAGVHELVAMNLVALASSGGRFDAVVIDTAPSRHAIEFVTYPGRLAALLGGRAVSWLAALARRSEGPASPGGEASTAALSGGTGYIARLVGRVTGPWLVRETALLFADLARVRERFVTLTSRAAELLLGERSAYTLVAAPTAAAHDDVRYLVTRLEKLGREPRSIVINRADAAPAPYAQALRASPTLPGAISEVLATLDEERERRTEAADRLAAGLAAHLPGVPQVRLSYVELPAPEAIVMALADELAPHLDTLLPAPV